MKLQILDEKEMRSVYAETLVELAERDDRVVALEADLSSAISTNKIKDILGSRYINVGIMEAQEMGAASGLAVAGFKPFIHTFGPFASRRAFDQVFLALNYAKTRAVLLGSDAGVTAEANGGTHMPFEDLALMRAIPNAHIYEVSDSKVLKYALQASYEKNGFSYIRTIRKQAFTLHQEDTDFSEGAVVLREGNQGAIIASGIMVHEALLAAEILAESDIQVMVIDMFRIKPINVEIVKLAAATGAIVTAENHNVIGGLGSAVAEVLSEEKPTFLHRVGVKEQFGQVGKTDYLKEVYDLTATEIVKQMKQLIKKKNTARIN